MDDRRKYWAGWRFRGRYLFDPAGNRYHQNEINAIFYQRQLHQELMGTPFKVKSLKQELERKIKATAPPEVVVKFGDGTQQTLKYNKFAV